MTIGPSVGKAFRCVCLSVRLSVVYKENSLRCQHSAHSPWQAIGMHWPWGQKAKGWVGFMALGLRLKRVRNEKRVGLHADTNVRVSSSRVRVVMAAACQRKRLRYRKHTHTHAHTPV